MHKKSNWMLFKSTTIDTYIVQKQTSKQLQQQMNSRYDKIYTDIMILEDISTIQDMYHDIQVY